MTEVYRASGPKGPWVRLTLSGAGLIGLAG